MPHLHCLKVTDIDPLCYPDDISTLLAKSPHLKDLCMHWSPRMRETQEPSVTFHDYFRHSIKERTPLKLRKVAFYNMYARNSNEWKEAIDESEVEEMIHLSNFDGQDQSRILTFLDKTWSGVRPQVANEPMLKSIRHDLISKDACEFLCSFRGLEKWYCVNFTHATGYRQNMRLPRPSSHQVTNGTSTISTVNAASGASFTPSSPRTPAAVLNPLLQLRDSYFHTILTNHGATLRHLVLPSRWPLSTKALARLVQACPNLEQLSMAPEVSTLEVCGLLLPFLSKLKAMRLLVCPTPTGQTPTQSSSMPISNMNMNDLAELDDDIHAEKFSVVLADRHRASQLKVIGIGWKAWELGDFYYIPVSTPPSSARPAEDVRLEDYTDSPLVPAPVGEHSRARPQRNLRSANTPSSSSKSPPSLLGKRTRDESSPPTESPSRVSLIVESDNFYGTLPSGETIAWRRNLRPANWDFLKKYEIWALDSQD
jgi:hypothetical protein